MAPPLNHRLLQIKSRKLAQIIILVFSVSCSVFCAYAQAPNYVRVAIIQDASSLRLKVKGGSEVVDPATQEVLSRNRNLNTTVTVYGGGILVGDIESNSSRLFIKAGDADAITINGRRYKGDIELIKKDNLHLLAVNHIGLEEYIKGILYHEASHYWPMEALKAQAIACRTYAVYQAQESKTRDYDITSDIYSQVYGGRTSERYRTNRAVSQTQGAILTYQDKVFPAYFHATCAGHTEDASLLWNIDIPVLKGVPCEFCKESPHFNWHCVLELGELRQRLVNAGYRMGMIKEIEVLGKNKSGRNTELKIITTSKEVKISAKDFRNIVGPNEIRSANFSVKVAGGDAVFEGLGWGHGVGLCQWGAYFMAKQGYKYEEILKYYYPQSDIKIIGF